MDKGTSMIKLSVVITGRDDGYGDELLTPYNALTPDTFCFRMKRTIQNNLSLLESKNIDVQYVVVDWSPINEKTLDKNEYTKIALQNKKVKHVIVPPESVSERGWNSKNFYEYYAKNVGIRNSDGEYILVTNPDILFTDEICNEIADIVNTSNSNNYYRPHSRKDVDNDLNLLAEGFSFPKTGLFVDEVLGTPASGDFVLTKKENFIDKAMGYNETRNTNANMQQTNLDGGIILNLFKAGIQPTKLNNSILHLDHAKPHQKDYSSTMHEYVNPPHWGLLKVIIN